MSVLATSTCRVLGLLLVCLASAGCSSGTSESAPPAATTQATPSATTTSTTTSRPQPRYVFPVSPASVARYSRSHHDYPAADIFAPCATAVVAVTDGRIDEVSTVDPWSSRTDTGATRGGRFVSLIGDDGVRYYGSHLADVAPGVRPGVEVRAGQRLGSVGESGNAKGTGCHLHFGISPPSEPGDWAVRRGLVWPWPYLDAWRAGTPKSPTEEVLSRGSPSPDGD